MNKENLISTLDKLFIGVSKLAINGELRTKSFENMIRYWHVKTAESYEDVSSIADINQVTGIPRATISDFLDGEKIKEKTDLLAVLLSELWAACNDKNWLPIKGDNSFYQISSKILTSTFSPDKALTKLIKLGAVELKRDGIILTSEYLNVSNDISETYKKVAQVTLWLIETALYNTVSDGDESLFQRSYYTTKVPTKLIPDLHQEVLAFIRKVYTELKEIIDSYEIDVGLGTFEEYGVSIFEFSNLFNNPKK